MRAEPIRKAAARRYPGWRSSVRLRKAARLLAGNDRLGVASWFLSSHRLENRSLLKRLWERALHARFAIAERLSGDLAAAQLPLEVVRAAPVITLVRPSRLWPPHRDEREVWRTGLEPGETGFGSGRPLALRVRSETAAGAPRRRPGTIAQVGWELTQGLSGLAPPLSAPRPRQHRHAAFQRCENEQYL